MRAARSALAALGTLVALPALVGVLPALSASPAAADSFTPVRMAISLAPVARLHVRLAASVAVSADPGVLDSHDGPLRVAVKLAPECGATFETTRGLALLDRPLSPQPTAGRAYSASAAGSGRPRRYGVQTVCVFLEDSGSDRVYANDESGQVDVSPSCTAAGRRYDAAHRALARARRQLHHSRPGTGRRRLQRTVTARARTLRRDRRRGTAACGRGVPL